MPLVPIRPTNRHIRLIPLGSPCSVHAPSAKARVRFLAHTLQEVVPVTIPTITQLTRSPRRQSGGPQTGIALALAPVVRQSADGIVMLPGCHNSSATTRNVVGALYSNALSGGAWPERALVFLMSR